MGPNMCVDVKPCSGAWVASVGGGAYSVAQIDPELTLYLLLASDSQ